MAEDAATATNFYAGDNFSDSMDNQKRALLAAMAERGAEGAQAFKTAQADTAAQRQASLNAAAARGAAINAPESLNAELNDSYDAMQNIGLGDSALSHDREIARITAANTAYLDQMKASGPLREEFYNAELAKIVALQQNSGGGYGGGVGQAEDRSLTYEELLALNPDNPYQLELDAVLPNPDMPNMGNYWDSAGFTAGRNEVEWSLREGATLEEALGAAWQVMADTPYGPGDGYAQRGAYKQILRYQFENVGGYNLTGTPEQHTVPQKFAPLGPDSYHQYQSGRSGAGQTRALPGSGGSTVRDGWAAPTPDTRVGSRPDSYVRRGPI